MAWAVFKKATHWSRPKSKFGFAAKPAPEPQRFPRDFIEHAVSIGHAQSVPTPARRKPNGA